MGSLPSVSGAERRRARRWDAIVLGTALPGLVASVRLAMHGKRVLVIEEPEAAAAYPGLREPFLVTGAESGSLLGPCMQALGLPLIDRRRLAPAPLAYQVALPDARLDVGDPALTVRELVAWGLAKPDDARAIVRALGAAVRAERTVLLDAATAVARRLPRTARRPAGPPLHPTAAAPTGDRGLPAEVTGATGKLAAFFEAQLRAFSQLAAARPSPEAAALLLGVGLDGGSASSASDTWMRPLLRRRIEGLFGEIRAVDEAWRVVTVDRLPALELEDSRELWVGRALLVNAPRAGLAAALGEAAPDFLRGSAPSYRHLTLHFRIACDDLPEAMASRVVVVQTNAPEPRGTDVVTIRTFPGETVDHPLDVIARAVVPADDPAPEAREAEIEAALAGLMPFSAGALERVPVPRPRWDDDAWLSDPPPGTAWPSEPPLRLSSRPPVYGLERGGFAGLGFEGDLVLGWRAGDAIAGGLG